MRSLGTAARTGGVPSYPTLENSGKATSSARTQYRRSALPRTAWAAGVAVAAVLVLSVLAAVPLASSSAPASVAGAAGGATAGSTGVAPSVVPATTPANNLAPIATIAVGGSPEFAVYDPANGFVYVPNWGNNNVSVIHGTSVIATLNVGSVPFSATYDPANQEVYVVNEGSNNVSVINGTSVVGSVHVGSIPQFASYDGANERLYVSNSGSSNVTVINGTSVVATIPVGADPSRVVIGQGSGGGGGGGWSPAVTNPVIYVPNTGSNNVTVVGGLTGTQVLASVPVGTSPQFGTWDPNNVWLYVPNLGSNNVSILTSTSPYKVLATVPVGSAPFSASFVPSTGNVLVVNSGSGTVSVLGGVLVESVVATIPVGSGPEYVTQDPAPENLLLVPNTGSGNVSVISGTKAVASLSAGGSPIFGTLDPANGLVYVQNFNSANLTVLGPSVPVTFKAHGLPPGTPWSVTAGSPPTTEANTTVNGLGTVVFHEVPGLLSFSFAGPAGYGIAKVVGTGLPSQSSVNVTGPSVLTVTFGALEKVFFNESALPQFELYAGATWSVNLTPALSHGGPAPQSASTNGPSLNFTAPAGASYKFVVTGPGAEYKVLPPKGGVHVPAHAFTKTVKFKLLTAAVIFKETGLASGTSWTVTISNGTSPVFVYPFSVSGNTSSIKLNLPAGNYTWSVSSAGHTPTTGSGALTVVVPSTATTIQTGPWT